MCGEHFARRICCPGPPRHLVQAGSFTISGVNGNFEIISVTIYQTLCSLGFRNCSKMLVLLRVGLCLSQRMKFVAKRDVTVDGGLDYNYTGDCYHVSGN